MSLESIDISCTDCKFSGGSAVADGKFVYKLSEGNIPIRLRLAWCHACQKIVPAEDLPTDDLLRQTALELEVIKKQIDLEVLHINKSRSFLSALLYPPRSAALGELELQEMGVKYDLDGIIESRKFVNYSRNPRCLACGSQEIVYLPKFPDGMHSALNEPTVPIRLGMKHPNCGGEFMVAYSVIRFYRRFSERLYSVDGIAVSIGG